MDGAKVDGWCSIPQNALAVRRRLGERSAAETFLHELGHLAWYAADLPADGAPLRKLTEEDVVSRLMPALFTIIRDNRLDFRGEPR